MKLNKRHMHEYTWGFVFILPQILGFLAFFLLPVVAAFYLSFTKWNLMLSPNWVGMVNYIRQFQDPKFYLILKNTLYFTFVYIPLVVIAALALA